MTPKKIVSLRVFRVAPAPKAPQLLLHLWTVPNRNFKSQRPDGYGDDVQSPFVLDVFTDERRPQYRTSLLLASSHAPSKIKLWYLNSKTKRGLVFHVTGARDFSNHFDATYFVFPFWPNPSQTSQTFKNYSAGNGSDVFFPKRAVDGTLQLIHSSGFAGSPVNIYEIWSWDEADEKFFLSKYYEPMSNRVWVWNRAKRGFELEKPRSE